MKHNKLYIFGALAGVLLCACNEFSPDPEDLEKANKFFETGTFVVDGKEYSKVENVQTTVQGAIFYSIGPISMTANGYKEYLRFNIIQNDLGYTVLTGDKNDGSIYVQTEKKEVFISTLNERATSWAFDTSKSYTKTYSVISEAAATSINEKYNLIKSNQEMNNDDFEDINIDSKSFTIYEFYKCTSDKTFMISNSKVEVISIEGHNHLIAKKNGSSVTCVKGSEEFNTSLDTILADK